MNRPEDPFRFLHHKITPSKSSKSNEPIQASALTGKVISNLRLLKSLMQSESATSKLFDPPSKESKSQVIKDQIVDELSQYEIGPLSQIVIPKRFFNHCFELLVLAWKKKIHAKTPTTLTLKDNPFSKESFRAFIIALSLNVSLSALRLERCSLAEYEMKLLAVFVKIHPTLTYLYLDENPLKDEGIPPLIAALEGNKQLLHLSLVKTELTDQGAGALCKQIASWSLQRLYLEKNDFSPRICKELQRVCLQAQCRLSIDD